MRSLRARLFAATLAALAVTLAVTITISAVLTRRQVDHVQATNLAARADDLAQQRRQHVSYTTQDSVAKNVRTMVARRSAFTAFVPNVNRSSDGQTSFDGRRELYSYRTLPDRGLLMLRPLSHAAWRPFLWDLVFAALAGVAFAALISFALARSIVRPLRRVADATRALAADERHEPLQAEGTTELAALANAFNQMAVDLDASREAERAFLLSVSHEFKTPLTAIRGYAEGLGEGAFEPQEAARTIGVEARRLERLVRDLLDLARMNRAEFSIQTGPVDLADVAREAVLRHHATARDFGVALSADARESWVEGDYDRLLQVASNLVENALRETPTGGAVTVTAHDALLAVADTGPGIPPGDVPHAFERFYLYDKIGRDRPVGSGLGLAIVKQLTSAMGGTVHVASSERGTTFTVSLRAQLRGVDDLEVGAGQRPERV
jgi:two-component system sensor histidine kinase BaeS